MIQRLNENNLYDIYDLYLRVGDKTQDFYITENKQRVYINSLNSIKKVLKRQEVYGLIDGDLKGVFIVYREKSFRPYLKILSENNEIARNLIKYVLWNYKEELFIKLNKENSLIGKKEIRRKNLSSIIYYDFLKLRMWKFKGDRGTEVLFCKEKFIPREDKNDSRHNSESQRPDK